MKLIVDNEEYLTLAELEKLVGLKETSIAMRVRFSNFPKPVKLEIRQAWKRSEIEAYIKASKKEQ